MIKNQLKDNALIKHSSLKKELHRADIKRVNRSALEYLEKILQQEILMTIEGLSRELTIKGKATLEKKDIKDFLSKQKKSEDWEA